MKQGLVAVDLETTGLSHNDKIIEIGVVKFDLDGVVIDKFNSLINPHTKLDKFITELTGIKQSEIDGAPDLSQIHDKVQEFLGNNAIVAHNAQFDVRFLRTSGWSIAGDIYDTYEMAQTLLPNAESYRLGSLAEIFNIPQMSAHRALADAEVASKIFLKLLHKLKEQPKDVLNGFVHLNRGYDWQLGLLAKTEISNTTSPKTDNHEQKAIENIIETVQQNASEVTSTLAKQKQFQTNPDDYLKMVDKVFAPDGVLKQVLDNFHYRATQAEMARNIAQVILNNDNLIAEAGTGIGKSLAYLIPAALYAVAFNSKVIISTHTINLQEQLMQKDINITHAVLEKLDIQDDLKVAILKGRANYICYNQWRRSVLEPPTEREYTTLLGKSLLWLPQSKTGDREEINLSGLYNTFFNYSAEKNLCMVSQKPCFLHKARQQATKADIIITNHHLLLTDLLGDSKLLPNCDLLVIDEAHHIGDVATNVQMFAYGRREVLALLEQLLIQTEAMAQQQNIDQQLDELKKMRDELSKNNHPVAKFFNALDNFMNPPTASTLYQLRIKPSTRARAVWNELLINWQDVKVKLVQTQRVINELVAKSQVHQEADSVSLNDANNVVNNVEAEMGRLNKMLHDLNSFMAEPHDNFVYWLEARKFATTECVIKSAPIDVSQILGDKLFDDHTGNVMIGATLSYENSLERFKKEIGIESTKTDIYTTDFDYSKNVMSLFVSDIPEPNSEHNLEKSATAIRSVFRGVNGRVLVLFTSKSKMEKTASILKSLIAQDDVKLIVQGRDGRPSQIQKALVHNERLIAFGMSSLWEGIDIDGGGLDAVIITHLPFPVPSEPINESRSELCDNAFADYFVPEAVKRFRQGFGRLIRSHDDKGIFVVLDSRILLKSYGRKFFKALPNTPKKKVPLQQLEEYIRETAARLGTMQPSSEI